MSYIFDQVFQDFITSIGHQKNAFPFYNIVAIDDVKFELHLALAGYSMDDIQISLEGEHLHIQSQRGVNDRTVKYLCKGFATKPFARKFILNSDVIVKSADFQDGILSIKMERVMPEQTKIRTIEINKPIKTILHG